MLLFICARDGRSQLSLPQGILSFCGGELFDTSCGHELKRNRNVSMKARQHI